MGDVEIKGHLERNDERGTPTLPGDARSPGRIEVRPRHLDEVCGRSVGAIIVNMNGAFEVEPSITVEESPDSLLAAAGPTADERQDGRYAGSAREYCVVRLSDGVMEAVSAMGKDWTHHTVMPEERVLSGKTSAWEEVADGMTLKEAEEMVARLDLTEEVMES